MDLMASHRLAALSGSPVGWPVHCDDQSLRVFGGLDENCAELGWGLGWHMIESDVGLDHDKHSAVAISSVMSCYCVTWGQYLCVLDIGFKPCFTSHEDVRIGTLDQFPEDLFLGVDALDVGLEYPESMRFPLGKSFLSGWFLRGGGMNRRPKVG